jgi:hypothetical protein
LALAIALFTWSPVPGFAASNSGGSASVDADFDGSGGAAVDVTAENSTTDSGNTTAGGAGSTQVGGTSGQQRTCTHAGEEIDCTSELGVWSQDRQCFVQRVSPEPPLDHPIWEGRDEGTIYQCSPAGAAFSAGTGIGFWFWAPSTGSAGAPILVDPVSLAEKAVERMELAAPEIGMTPMSAGAPLLVGMDAWLWVDNAGPRGFGPITRTATAGPTSVTATAEVSKVVWDMGDGTRITCRSAGTPWSPAKGTGASPSCGHRYLTPSTQQDNGTFKVRATTYWRVDWSGAGQSGRITFTMSGERRQPVTEVQVLQTR